MFWVAQPVAKTFVAIQNGKGCEFRGTVAMKAQIASAIPRTLDPNSSFLQACAMPQRARSASAWRLAQPPSGSGDGRFNDAADGSGVSAPTSKAVGSMATDLEMSCVL